MAVEASPRMEEWSEMINFTNYLVSSEGRLYSILTDKMLAGSVDCMGYTQYSLTTDEGRVRVVRGHRAVAMAFLDNLDNHPVIDHINRVKTDNRLVNLRWASKSDNTKNSDKCGRRRGS